MGGLEESTLLELGKVKPIGEEESKKSKPIGEEESKKSKPEGNYREEEQIRVNNHLPNWRRRHPCLACCGACCFLLIIILVVFIILLFTLFKAKDPRIHVDNITLESFNISLLLNLPPSLSVSATLGLAISLKNPNWASVRYTNSTAHMFYRGVEVGFFPIPPGHVGLRRTTRIFSTIDLMGDRLIGNSHILTDFTSGSLPFSTITHVSGKLKLLNIYKHHFDSSSTCDISIFTSNRSISDMICTYDINL